MQDKGPDMEELFREAAENYPLKKGDDQWDLLLTKIIAGNHTGKRESLHYRRYTLVLALLLLFLFLGYFSLVELGGGGNIDQQLAQKTIGHQRKNNASNRLPVPGERTGAGKQGNDVSPQNAFVLNDNVDDFCLPAELKNENRSVDCVLSRNIQPAELVSDVSQSPMRSILPVTTLAEGSPTSTENQTANFRSNRWYYGFFAAASVSSVKNSGLEKTGYELGVLLGYQLSDRFSVETGLSLTRKQYPSKGKYFNSPSMTAAGMDVMELDGRTTVLQLPVELRYDLNHSVHRRIFASAGATSYMVLGEQNDYEVMVNGNHQEMFATYKENKPYLAAAIQLGIGYELKTAKETEIRIQPFVQIPIRGIGVGQLPVTTAGLRIGLSRHGH